MESKDEVLAYTTRVLTELERDALDNSPLKGKVILVSPHDKHMSVNHLLDMTALDRGVSGGTARYGIPESALADINARLMMHHLIPPCCPPGQVMSDAQADDGSPVAPNFILTDRYKKGKQSRRSKQRRKSW